MLERAETFSAQDKNGCQSRKGLSIAKTDWRSRQITQNRRKMVDIPEKTLGIDEKCLQEPISDQQRRKTT